MITSRISRRIHRELAASFSAKRVGALHSGPVISFTFDDFPRSAFLCAGQLLERYGVFGTYYAALGLAGRRTSVGELFNSDDVRSLVNQGHELACHSLSHTSALTSTPDAMARDCSENRRVASELLPGYQMLNYSYPFGDTTLAVKRRLAAIYSSCRTATIGINTTPFDMAFLRGNPVYETVPLSTIRTMIDKTARANGWLIFYTHDVTDSPSPFGCRPQHFQDVLKCALASGAKVLCVRDALVYFAAQPLLSSEVSGFEEKLKGEECDA